MKPIYNHLLRLGLSVGLTQRDVFVDEVSKFLEEKMNTDPEKGAYLAESLMDLAELLKAELTREELIACAVDAMKADLTAKMAAVAEALATNRERAWDPCANPENEDQEGEASQAGKGELIAKIDELNRLMQELIGLLK